MNRLLAAVLFLGLIAWAMAATASATPSMGPSSSPSPVPETTSSFSRSPMPTATPAPTYQDRASYFESLIYDDSSNSCVVHYSVALVAAVLALTF